MSKKKSKRGVARKRKEREKTSPLQQSAGGFLDPQSRRFDIVVVCLYLLLTLLLFREFIFSGGMLYGSDSIPSGVFFRGFYRDFVREYHALPRWDPYILGGLPFIDAMHGDTFYPTSLLKFFMPLHRAMGLKLVLHVFLAGMFMYFFLKSMKLNRFAAAFGGLCYMFASVFVSLVFAGHDAKIFVIALLPLCFFFLERGFETGRLFYFIMMGGAIGFLILSSHVQMAYFALWAIGLYLLFRLVLLWMDKKKPKVLIGKILLYFVIAIMIGLGFGLVQLLPSYVFVNNYSVREEKTGFDHATSWSLHAEEVGSLVVPEFSGDSVTDQNTYWGRNPFKLNAEYVGLVPLIFAVLALLVVRSRRIIFFSVCALLAVIYGLGGDTPIFHLFYHLVPGVKLFRGPSMIMFLFSFAVCLVAAVGFHSFTKNSFTGRRLEKILRGLAVASGITLVGAILISLMQSGFFSLWTEAIYSDIASAKQKAMLTNVPRFVTGVWITVFLLLSTIGLMWARLKGKIAPLLFLCLLVLLVLIDTWRVDARFIEIVDLNDPEVNLRRDETIDFLKKRESQIGPFRVFPVELGYVGRKYGNNTLGVHRIESVSGFHDNELKWFNAFTNRNRMNLFRPSFLDLLNVKYVLWDPDEKALQGYFDQMESEGRFTEVSKLKIRYQDRDGQMRERIGVKIFENRNALPRAWIASQYEVADSSALFDSLSHPAFDFRNTVLLEEDPGIHLGGADSLVSGQVKGIEYDGNRIEIQVGMEAPGFLVLSDNHFPYWHVHVDGVEKKMYRAYYTLRAVFLEPGDHAVVFTYVSRPYEIGLGISGLAFLFMSGAVLLEVGKRVRKRKGKET